MLEVCVQGVRHRAKNGYNLRRVVAFFVAVVLLLATAQYITSSSNYWPSPNPPEPLRTEEVAATDQSAPVVENVPVTTTRPTGMHLHVQSTEAAKEGAGIPGCLYPILIHVTPDVHCTGALGLYGSIVRNVLMQPESLKGAVCVHFTFVDPALKTIEEMYKWTPRPNPFMQVKDCALINEIAAYNEVVPVRWQALTPIEVPSFMQAELATWTTALNKVHSWAFDLYPRILILDADSVIITELHKIFTESPTDLTIAAPADQYLDCNDRTRLNGGMVLLRPSRYFHMVATELLYEQGASCISSRWQQSEQELLNCICGTIPGHQALRPEFQCRIMPIYNSIWPKNYGCSDANVIPWRSIHFTAAPKPWKVKEEDYGYRFDTNFWRCVRDLTRKGETRGLEACEIPGFEETRGVADWRSEREMDVIT